MYFIKNGTIEESKLEASFYSENRAMQYADGFFETMKTLDGKIIRYDLHLQRLSEGMKQMRMIVPEDLLQETIITNKIEALRERLNLDKKSLRVKIIVWRKSGGLVLPNTNECDYVITLKPFQSAPLEKELVYLYKENFLSFGSLSPYKKLNFQTYIHARICAQEQGAEDALLLDNHGHIAEMSASNVFVFKNNTFYTPSIQSGCIAGVRRNIILENFKKGNIPYEETLFRADFIKDAEILFSVNISGVSILKQILQSDYQGINTNEFLKKWGYFLFDISELKNGTLFDK